MIAVCLRRILSENSIWASVLLADDPAQLLLVLGVRRALLLRLNICLLLLLVPGEAADERAAAAADAPEASRARAEMLERMLLQ